MEHLKKLERMYLAAPVHDELYPEIQIGIERGSARVKLPVSKRYFHSAMTTHGSVYFKLLDDAAYFAAQSFVEDRFLLTSEFNIRFIAPVKSGILTAKGACQNAEGRLIEASSELFDHNGDLCAKGRGKFAKSGMALKEVRGYS